MYNVKFFCYPSGWQVRVYSVLVGYKEKPDIYGYVSDEIPFYPLWDEKQQEYVYQRVLPEDTWFNPFSQREEKIPMEYDEALIAAKKKRSIASSMNRTVNAVYQIARSNIWDWFITFTFNPDLVDSFDYEAVTKKLSKWLNNAKQICPEMGYIIVPEKHKKGRYHFHGLFKNCDDLGFVDSGHREAGQPVYNVGKYKFGWTTATKVVSQDRVTKYLSKYISKDLCSVAFGKRRYWASRNLDETDIREVILDKPKLDLLVKKLELNASHIKRFENSEIETTYYEIPLEVTMDDNI